MEDTRGRGEAHHDDVIQFSFEQALQSSPILICRNGLLRSSNLSLVGTWTWKKRFFVLFEEYPELLLSNRDDPPYGGERRTPVLLLYESGRLHQPKGVIDFKSNNGVRFSIDRVEGHPKHVNIKVATSSAMEGVVIEGSDRGTELGNESEGMIERYWRLKLPDESTARLWRDTTYALASRAPPPPLIPDTHEEEEEIETETLSPITIETPAPHHFVVDPSPPMLLRYALPSVMFYVTIVWTKAVLRRQWQQSQSKPSIAFHVPDRLGSFASAAIATVHALIDSLANREDRPVPETTLLRDLLSYTTRCFGPSGLFSPESLATKYFWLMLPPVTILAISVASIVSYLLPWLTRSVWVLKFWALTVLCLVVSVLVAHDTYVNHWRQPLRYGLYWNGYPQAMLALGCTVASLALFNKARGRPRIPIPISAKRKVAAALSGSLAALSVPITLCAIDESQRSKSTSARLLVLALVALFTGLHFFGWALMHMKVASIPVGLLIYRFSLLPTSAAYWFLSSVGDVAHKLLSITITAFMELARVAVTVADNIEEASITFWKATLSPSLFVAGRCLRRTFVFFLEVVRSCLRVLYGGWTFLCRAGVVIWRRQLAPFVQFLATKFDRWYAFLLEASVTSWRQHLAPAIHYWTTRLGAGVGWLWEAALVWWGDYLIPSVRFCATKLIEAFVWTCNAGISLWRVYLVPAWKSFSVQAWSTICWLQRSVVSVLQLIFDSSLRFATTSYNLGRRLFQLSMRFLTCLLNLVIEGLRVSLDWTVSLLRKSAEWVLSASKLVLDTVLKPVGCVFHGCLSRTVSLVGKIAGLIGSVSRLLLNRLLKPFGCALRGCLSRAASLVGKNAELIGSALGFVLEKLLKPTSDALIRCVLRVIEAIRYIVGSGLDLPKRTTELFGTLLSTSIVELRRALVWVANFVAQTVYPAARSVCLPLFHALIALVGAFLKKYWQLVPAWLVFHGSFLYGSAAISTAGIGWVARIQYALGSWSLLLIGWIVVDAVAGSRGNLVSQRVVVEESLIRFVDFYIFYGLRRVFDSGWHALGAILQLMLGSLDFAVRKSFSNVWRILGAFYRHLVHPALRLSRKLVSGVWTSPYLSMVASLTVIAVLYFHDLGWFGNIAILPERTLASVGTSLVAAWRRVRSCAPTGLLALFAIPKQATVGAYKNVCEPLMDADVSSPSVALCCWLFTCLVTKTRTRVRIKTFAVPVVVVYATGVGASALLWATVVSLSIWIVLSFIVDEYEQRERTHVQRAFASWRRLRFAAEAKGCDAHEPVETEHQQGSRGAFRQKECSICLESFEHDRTKASTFPCGHIFHSSCAHTWLQQPSSHQRCPMCRRATDGTGRLLEVIF